VAKLQTACRGGAPRALARNLPFFLQSEVPPKKYLPVTGIVCSMQNQTFFDRGGGGQFNPNNGVRSSTEVVATGICSSLVHASLDRARRPSVRHVNRDASLRRPRIAMLARDPSRSVPPSRGPPLISPPPAPPRARNESSCLRRRGPTKLPTSVAFAPLRDQVSSSGGRRSTAERAGAT
jgi:hypothetical protein